MLKHLPLGLPGRANRLRTMDFTRDILAGDRISTLCAHAVRWDIRNRKNMRLKSPSDRSLA